MTLYLKLCKALEENEIDELGLIHMIPEVTELPSESQAYHPLVVIESKLGISKHSLATLLKEAHERYIATPQYDEKALEQVTRVMIILKPDNYTAMNRRKELILSGKIDILQELKLIELIFTIPKHSKSSVAWYHRQWIFSQFQNNPPDVKKEFHLCCAASDAYPRNYYAWTYRYWVLSTYGKNDLDLVQREYIETCDWIARNISDYSGFQYLQQLVQMLTWDDTERNTHMAWLDNLIVKYPGHESLWCHRRFCSHRFKDSDSFCASQHQFVHDIMSDRFSSRSLSDNANDFVMQKEFALKFGLFHTLMEKKPNLNDDAKLYLTVAPTPNFLDRQELMIQK